MRLLLFVYIIVSVVLASTLTTLTEASRAGAIVKARKTRHAARPLRRGRGRRQLLGRNQNSGC